MILFEMGSNEEAKEYFLKALKIYEEIYKDNSNHPQLATSYLILFSLYEDSDKEKANEYFKKYVNSNILAAFSK